MVTDDRLRGDGGSGGETVLAVDGANFRQRPDIFFFHILVHHFAQHLFSVYRRFSFSALVCNFVVSCHTVFTHHRTESELGGRRRQRNVQQLSRDFHFESFAA